MYVTIEQTEAELLEHLIRALPDIKVEAFPSAGRTEADKRAAANPNGYAALHLLQDNQTGATSRSVDREFVLFLGVKGLRQSKAYKGAYAEIENLRVNSPFRVGGLWEYKVGQVRFLTETRGVWWFQISIRGQSLI